MQISQIVRAICIASIAASTAGAQVRVPMSTTLVGMARDSAGAPIANVEVWIRGTDLYTHTNAIGGFRFPGAPEGSVKLTMRRLGYEQATVDLELKPGRIDSLVVALTAIPAVLAGVNVNEDVNARSKRLLAGFWERKARGIGNYMTREEVIERNAHSFPDLVRMKPGTQIVMVNGRKQVRFSRSPTIRGDCPPLYFLDGMRIENATGEEVQPGDVEAIEMYSSTATIPPQFQPRMVANPRTCGVIVVWTRLPGS